MNLALDENEKRSLIKNNKVKIIEERGHLAYELPLETKKNILTPQFIESNIYKTLYGTYIFLNILCIQFLMLNCNYV